MTRFAAQLGYILWFGVAFAGAFHLAQRGRDAVPEIDRRARVVAMLERAVVAARRAAYPGGGPFDRERFEKVFLEHGVRVRDWLSAKPPTLLRARIGDSRSVAAEMTIVERSAGRRLVVVEEGRERRFRIAALLGVPEEE